MKDLRFLEAKDIFLERAYLALKNQFPSRDAFDAYFNAIKDDEQKNLFLKTAYFSICSWLRAVTGWLMCQIQTRRLIILPNHTNTWQSFRLLNPCHKNSSSIFINF